DAKLLTIAIRGVERLVDQADPPVSRLEDVDRFPPLLLQMRQPHQEVQLRRRIGLEVAASTLRETRQDVAGVRGLLSLHTLASSIVGISLVPGLALVPTALLERLYQRARGCSLRFQAGSRSIIGLLRPLDKWPSRHSLVFPAGPVDIHSL